MVSTPKSEVMTATRTGSDERAVWTPLVRPNVTEKPLFIT